MGARKLSYHFPFLRDYKEINSVHTGLPNRHESTNEYRYGFQGQEKDDEIKGEGNSFNYKYRMHDARVGRFFAVDPLTAKYPHYTPYSFSGNKVINSIELEGLEDLKITGNVLKHRPYSDIPFKIDYSTPNVTSIDLSKTENAEIKKRIEKQANIKLNNDWHIQINSNVKVTKTFELDESLTDETGDNFPIVYITTTTTVTYTIKIYDSDWNEIKNVSNKQTTTIKQIGILNEGNGEGTLHIYWEDAPLKDVNPSDVPADNTVYKPDTPIDSTESIYSKTKNSTIYIVTYHYKDKDGKDYYKKNGLKVINNTNESIIFYHEYSTNQPKYHPSE